MVSLFSSQCFLSVSSCYGGTIWCGCWKGEHKFPVSMETYFIGPSEDSHVATTRSDRQCRRGSKNCLLITAMLASSWFNYPLHSLIWHLFREFVAARGHGPGSIWHVCTTDPTGWYCGAVHLNIIDGYGGNAVGKWTDTVSSCDLLVSNFLWNPHFSNPDCITPCWEGDKHPQYQSNVWWTGF